MATLSSIFTWEIPLTEETEGLQSIGLQKSQIQCSHEKTTARRPARIQHFTLAKLSRQFTDFNLVLFQCNILIEQNISEGKYN